ncbi:MAG: MBL fold metallo-hydrolase, partial [Planctomycetota bacterium]
MSVTYRVISIGTLAAHPLWNERSEVRTGHTTTVLVEAGDRRILVDPGLPAPALAARLDERCSHRPDEITDVFLTNYQPDHRRGLELFPQASWLLQEAERE